MNAYAIPGIVRTIGELATNIQLSRDQLKIKAEAAVCSVWGVSPIMLHDKTRKRGVVEARQVLFFWHIRSKQMSLKQVGALYGKDHATVMHGRKVVANLIETSHEFREKYNTAMSMIERIVINNINHETN